MHARSSSVSAGSGAASPARTASVVAILVALAHTANDAYAAFLHPLLPRIMGKLGLSIALTASLAVTLSLAASLLQPVMGYLADRYGRRLFVILGPLLSGVALSLIGTAPSFGVLMLLLVVGGLGSAAFHPPGASLAARVSDGSGSGKRLSFFSFAGSAGYAAGPLLAVGLVSVLGLGKLWLAMIPAVLLALVLARLLPAERPAAPVRSRVPQPRSRAPGDLSPTGEVLAGGPLVPADGPLAPAAGPLAPSAGPEAGLAVPGLPPSPAAPSATPATRPALPDVRSPYRLAHPAMPSRTRLPARVLARLRGPLGVLFGISAVSAFVQRVFLTMEPIIIAGSGGSEAAGALALSVFLAGQALGSLAGGVLADRFDRQRVLLALTLLSLPTFTVALWLPAGSPAALVFAALAGLLNMAILPPVVVVAQEILPSRAALGSGIVMGLAWGTGAIGVLGAGALGDVVGARTAALLSLPVILVGTLLALQPSLRNHRRPAAATASPATVSLG